MSETAQVKLQSFVRRIESVEDEIKALNDDKSEIYKEARGDGFDVKILRKVVAARRMDAEERRAQGETFELYWEAIHGAPEQVVRAHVENIEQFPVEHDEDGVFPDDEPQPAPQAAQMLAKTDVSFSVAVGPNTSLPGAEGIEDREPIQPETAAMPHSTEPALEQVLSGSQTDLINPSSGIGETGVRGAGGAVNFGGKSAGARASAALPVEYAAPGVITTEHTPPEPVKRHPYSMAFGETGQDISQLRKDIHAKFGGVTEPIVKIGPSILSGWARYNISRSMMIDYPVVQYGGADALADVIAWNLESRTLTPSDRKAIAARLAKLHPERSDEINDLMGVAETLEAVA